MFARLSACRWMTTALAAAAVLAGCDAKVDTGASSATPTVDRQPSTGPAVTLFTCPMHPEVEAGAPGLCPTCRMALRPKAASPTAVSTVVDPICEMKIPDSSPLRSEHGGKTYFFCGPACKNSFDKDPGRYAK